MYDNRGSLHPADVIAWRVYSGAYLQGCIQESFRDSSETSIPSIIEKVIIYPIIITVIMYDTDTTVSITLNC